MKKGVLAIIVIMVLVAATSHNKMSQHAKIYWTKSIHITKDNFECLDSKQQHDIIGHIDFYLNYKFNKDSVRISSQAYFVKATSCLKNRNLPDSLLLHAQNHFNICEVNRRLMMKDLTRMKFKTVQEAQFKLKELDNLHEENLNDESSVYNQETNFGKNWKAMLQWKIKIEKELKETEKFSDTLAFKKLK